jgi:hypothetical protein
MEAKFPESDYANRLLDYLNQQGKKAMQAKGSKVKALLSYGKHQCRRIAATVQALLLTMMMTRMLSGRI